MTRLLFRFLFIPVAVGWLFSGCSEKIEPVKPTYSQLLTGVNQKTWRTVSLQIFDEGQSDGVVPITRANINPCIADDLVTFYAGDERKFEASEGATRCSAGDPDVYITDTWTLINANATVDFYLPILNGKFPWIIKNLTGTVMTIEYYIPDLDASYRFTLNSVSTK